MKKYRFKQFESDNYLIPVEKVQDFDYLSNFIDNHLEQEESNKELYEWYDDFNQQFSQYIIKSNLQNIPLFINEGNLK